MSAEPSRPRVPLAIEEVLAALAMSAVALITFANVLTRYFTDLSFAFTEEFSICLMLIMTFLGASVAVVRDRHMRITFLIDKLGPRRRRIAELFAVACVLAMFAILTVFGAQATWDEYRFEVTSPALGVPQWLYTLWMPLLSAVVCGRAVGRGLRLWRGAAR